MARILDDNYRLFKIWGTVDVKDRHGERLPVEHFKKLMPIWMARGAPITYNHSNKVVGKGLSYEFTNKEIKGEEVPAILITGMVFDDYELDDIIWNKLKDGEIEGLSFGGAGEEDIEEMLKNGSEEGLVKVTEAYEFALVDRPANPEATPFEINETAKMAIAKCDRTKQNFQKRTPQAISEINNYQNKLLIHGDNAKGVGWRDEESQTKRFELAKKYINEGGSVLDVGAGLGHLAKHLPNNHYEGIEVIGEYVDACVAKGLDVEQGDVLDLIKKHDHVVALGTFAYLKKDYPTPEVVDKAVLPRIKTMYRNCRKNAIATFHVTSPNPEYVTFTEKQLESYAQNINPASFQIIKDARLRDGEVMMVLNKTTIKDIEKKRVYLKPGEKAPEGAKVQQGARGGQYYESTGSSQEDNKPQTSGVSDRQATTMSMDPDVSAEELASKVTPEQLRRLSESPMADKAKVTRARLLQEKKPESSKPAGTQPAAEEKPVPEQDYRDEDGEPDYDAAAQYNYGKDYGELTAEQQRRVESEVRYSVDYYENQGQENDQRYRDATGKDPKDIPEAGNVREFFPKDAKEGQIVRIGSDYGKVVGSSPDGKYLIYQDSEGRESSAHASDVEGPNTDRTGAVYDQDNNPEDFWPSDADTEDMAERIYHSTWDELGSEEQDAITDYLINEQYTGVKKGSIQETTKAILKALDRVKHLKQNNENHTMAKNIKKEDMMPEQEASPSSDDRLAALEQALSTILERLDAIAPAQAAASEVQEMDETPEEEEVLTKTESVTLPAGGPDVPAEEANGEDASEQPSDKGPSLVAKKLEAIEKQLASYKKVEAKRPKAEVNKAKTENDDLALKVARGEVKKTFSELTAMRKESEAQMLKEILNA